jgi:tetratricopeptide (TPR) repeat protein
MGDPEAEYTVPELHRRAPDDVIALLNRVAEIGLLAAVDNGAYAIHPALPWHFRALFAEFYGQTQSDSAVRAVRAYVNAISELGHYYHDQFADGRAEVVESLRFEEANLLRAREIACAHGWWENAIGAMEGLRILYEHGGRTSEWKHLVDVLAPNLVDPATGGPLTGYEPEWATVTRYHVDLAKDALNWAEAERLQQVLVNRARERATPVPAERQVLTEEQRDRLSSLAVNIERLGHVLLEQGRRDCLDQYKEARSLYRLIGDAQSESTIAFNLGRVYMEIPDLQDLDQAERWYRVSLQLCGERDRLGRARSIGQLGSLAYERFKHIFDAAGSEDEWLRYFDEAVSAYERALDLMPAGAVKEFAVIHNQLGALHTESGDSDAALAHYRESARYSEIAGDTYGAGQIRFNIAFALFQADRFDQALVYAKAALRDFEQLGPGAAAVTDRAHELIARASRALTASGGEDE